MKLASSPRMALAALIVCTSAAHAGLINGSINFSSGAGGGIVLQDSAGNVTTNLLDVKGIQSWLFAEVEEGTGSFDSVPDGAAVLFSQPWVFNPSTPKTPLWSIAGPDNFTFNLINSTVVYQSASFLAVKGTGTLTGTGYSATPGTWYFTTQGVQAAGLFSWSSSTKAVPDAGTTLALLGGSLLGLCGLRRKLASAAMVVRRRPRVGLGVSGQVTRGHPMTGKFHKIPRRPASLVSSGQGSPWE